MRCAGDRRLDLRLLALGALEIGAGADVALGEVAQPVPLAGEIVLPRQQFGEVRLGGARVKPRKDGARLHRVALAAAELDDPRLHQRRHLGPGHRLDDARRVDDLGRVAARDLRDLHLPRSGVEHPGAGEGGRDRETGQDADQHGHVSIVMMRELSVEAAPGLGLDQAGDTADGDAAAGTRLPLR